MNRSARLLLGFAWLGACSIGALCGSQLPRARSTLPVWVVFGILAVAWGLITERALRRVVPPVTSWAIRRTLLVTMYLSMNAASIGMIISRLVSDRLSAAVWAAGIGLALGGVTAAVHRPDLSPRDWRRWLVVCLACGALSLVTATLLVHPLEAPVPDLRASLLFGAVVALGWGVVPGALLGPLLARMPAARMADIERRMARQMRPRRRWIERAAVAIAVVIALVVIFDRRCEFVTCRPATWGEILAAAEAEARRLGPSYAIGDISAEPSYRSEMTAEGPGDLDLHIELMALPPGSADAGAYTWRAIAMADRDMRVREAGSGAGMRAPLPSPEQLRRVRIGPRDAYRIVWAAQRDSAAIRTGRYPTARLYVDELPKKRFGVESAWAVSYSDDTAFITCWVDAQTGAIVGQQRLPHGSP